MCATEVGDRRFQDIERKPSVAHAATLANTGQIAHLAETEARWRFHAQVVSKAFRMPHKTHRRGAKDAKKDEKKP